MDKEACTRRPFPGENPNVACPVCGHYFALHIGAMQCPVCVLEGFNDMIEHTILGRIKP